MRRVCAVLMLLVLGGPARADDWEIKRSPLDPRAIARYEAALERDPDDALALRKLVELYRKHATIGELADRFAHRRAWQSRAVLADLQAKELGQPDRAIQTLEQTERGHGPVDARLGGLYARRGREADARAAYERALVETKAGAARRPLLQALADLALAGRDPDGARRYFDALTALDPHDLKLRLAFAEALERTGADAAEVLAALERAQAEAPRADPQLRAELLERTGGAAETAGKDDRALGAYAEALALVPRDHYLRREILERVIGVHRRRDGLGALAARWEREWTQKGFLEWDLLSRVYDELGDQTRAEAALRRALEADPRALASRARYVALLDRLGRADDALREHERLVQLAPGEPKHQLALAERLWRRGDKARALEVCARLATRFASDPGVHSALEELYERYGEPDKALREAERLVALEPDEESHWVALGEQWFQRGNKAKAIETWRRLRNPLRLAEVFAEHDLAAEALDLYERAARQNPKDPQIQREIAQVLERQKRTDEAASAWQKVLELATGSGGRALRREARSRLISLLAREHRLGGRLAPYVARFAKDPHDVDAGAFLAEAHAKLGQLDAAEAVLRKLLAALPDDVDALAALAQVQRARHDYAGAIATLSRLAELAPARAKELYAQMAELALALYHDDDAVHYAKKAVEAAPHDPAPHQRLAEILERKDDLDGAIAAYGRAVLENPRLWKAHFALARLHVRAGRLADAARIYRTVALSAPDDETVLEAARRGLDVEEYAGTLGELERELRPLVFEKGQRPVYRRVLVELYARYAPPVARRAAQGDADAKAELRGIGEHGLRPLLEALEDADPQGQATAIEILRRAGNPAAAMALARLGSGQPLGDPPRKPELALRVAAIAAAGRLADARTVSPLSALLRDDELGVREAAVWALGQLRDPAARRALLGLIGDPSAAAKTPEPVALACVALATSAASAGADTQPIAARIAALAASDGQATLVRAAAAYSLGRLGNLDARTTELLVHLAGQEDEQQAAAVTALGLLRVGSKGQSADRQVTATLVRALFVGREPARRAARAGLCGSPSDFPSPPAELVSTAGKPDPKLTLDGLVPSTPPTCNAGAPLDPPLMEEAIAALGQALGRHRDLALRALTDLDPPDDAIALGPLGLAARDPDALSALAQPVAILVGHLDPEVRRHALRLLAKLGEPAAEGAIERAIGDDAIAVAREAATAARLYLARAPTRAESLGRAIVERLASPRGAERLAAVQTLAADPALLAAAAARLTALAGDDDGFVREAARAALARAGARPVTPRR
jgi:tetratricopeptide (TPR) repeat protein/HEAT repeat protein